MGIKASCVYQELSGFACSENLLYHKYDVFAISVPNYVCVAVIIYYGK